MPPPIPIVLNRKAAVAPTPGNLSLILVWIQISNQLRVSFVSIYVNLRREILKITGFINKNSLKIVIKIPQKLLENPQNNIYHKTYRP